MPVPVLRATILATALPLAAGAAQAGGFAINEHSASQLGTAYAGAAAAAEDASTIADNPAGLARLTAPQAVVSGTVANPSLPFSNQGSHLVTGMPTPGPNDDGGNTVLIPSFFLSAPATSGLTLGLGLMPSFGLATDYTPEWVGRYHALSTELTSIDLAPTVAYRFSPMLAVGIGPVVRYSKIKYSNEIDFGTIGAGLGVPGAVPGANDGSVKVLASDFSFGFNGGALVEPTPGTRIGLAYFHNDAAKVTGTARFGLSPVGAIISAASGAFVNTGAGGVIAYPDRANVGVVQQITPDLDLRAGLTWTQWSSFKEERIIFANPAQPTALTIENWQDTVTVAVGGTYQLNPVLKLRAGIGYDQTPVPDPMHRTPRLPDTDRINLAAGLGYQLTDAIGLDAAYEHVFGGTARLNVISATGDVLSGTTHLSADLFALQLTYRF